MDSIIVEIRMGAGGEEAALFAGDLFKMYSKYAELNGWKTAVLDSNSSSIGGFKQVIFQVQGNGVLSKIKYEAGVHRVQRIPKTEKGNRVHTSTCSVAVLKIPSSTEIKIAPSEIKMDTYKASGHGGQNVNKRMTAVRITHLPTGTVVTCQTERNLQQNKENALSLLRAKLLEKEEIANFEKLSKERKAQIGSSKRAEKIRTYNFPQDRITDHRLKKSWYNIEKIMSGHLDPLFEKLRALS